MLAIAAAKLGFEPVLGVDSEQAAIEECARNARLNYVEIECSLLDLRTQAAPVADVVTANLTRDLLEKVAANWAEGEKRPQTLIASGFLAGEADGVRTAIARAGLETQHELARGEWAALLAAPH